MVDGAYLPGNRFERIQSPPYYMANNKPFWPSLVWETHIRIPANDPLNITTPNVLPEMIPLQFFTGETDGLLVNTISVKYDGSQASVNTLFVYVLRDAVYYCIGAIALPVSANSLPPQPVYLLGPGDEIIVDSYGEPVFVTSTMGQGDPLSMPLPPLLLGAGTLRYGLRLAEDESIYLGIAQELTTSIEVIARGQRYTKNEMIAASLGAA